MSGQLADQSVSQPEPHSSHLQSDDEHTDTQTHRKAKTSAQQVQHTTDAVEEEKHTERLSKKRVVVVVVVLLLGYLRERERE